jgi:ATP-dependent Clp protease ATP-binding subunit ClpC
MGPTGVGKTFTAKILADALFQSEQALIRINMSELRERHSIASLVGAPAGYVGYGEGGKFTEKVRRKPYSVILFDEIEKAHPDILNILLQILEDGELVDADGRRISFSNTVILLTTNIGSQEIAASQNSFGFSQKDHASAPSFDALQTRLKKELKSHIKPEILSRLDEVLIYQPLTKKELRRIILKEIQQTKKKLKKKGITLDVSPEAIQHITQLSLRGFQGARLVRKNVHEHIENRIALKLAQSESEQTSYVIKKEKGELIIQ